MRPPMIRAVVFDFDGLILDTEGPILTAWQEVFDTHGCPPLTIEEWSAEIGTIRGLDIVALLRERATVPVDVDAMTRSRRARCKELIAAEIVRPGVHEWLDEAAALGLRVAIASSSAPDWVRGHVERLGLLRHFEHVACADGDLAPKPAPDTYLAACAALGVPPGEALAVEDSPHGVTAAKTAGLACVAVPNPITAQLDLTHADVRLPSLAASTLSQTLSRLGANGSGERPGAVERRES